jgi:hypothetical protein
MPLKPRAAVAIAATIAAVVVLVVLLIVAYVWYNHTGWTQFSYRVGESPSWVPAAGGDVGRLRFKNCVFTITRSDGVIRTQDVSPVLNSMAVGQKGNAKPPTALTLDRPMNPFSFVISGFNDRASVPDPTGAPWCTAPPTICTSDVSCPNFVDNATTAGLCIMNGSRGICSSCPGGATVTLTGKVRTI